MTYFSYFDHAGTQVLVADCDYGGLVEQASNALAQKLKLPSGYIYQWSGEYEFQLRAKERLKIIMPVWCFLSFSSYSI
jgi:Cu(I)/Ag(I) efflux system membrane protein CusA/SilA